MKNIEFNSLHISHIFKSSKKYLIGIAKNSTNSRYVFKIANNDNERLNKEINRINELRAQYGFMEKRLAPVINQGVLEKGHHKGKCYFLSQLIEGDTFSHFIQNPSINHNNLKKGFDYLLDKIIEFCRDHKFNPNYHKSSGSFIKSSIRSSILRLNDLRNISVLLDFDKLTINECVMVNLGEVIDQILDHTSLKWLDESDSFISDIGHWNFHGDNILIKNMNEIENFSLIDPDISLDTCDPLFTLARFIYTYPHDTADYNQYLIESDLLQPSSIGNNYFNLKVLWPEVIFNTYSELFYSIFPQSKLSETNVIKILDDKNELLRLELNYLLCLLRGINANYEDKFTMPSGKLNFFRNKGIFLYIQTVIFANKLKDRLYGN